MKEYNVCLNEEQRKLLESMINGGKESARSQLHARILLHADSGERGSHWTDQQISQALQTSVPTVERVRKRFLEGGLLDAVVRRPQPERPEQRKLDGEQEAHLVALCCSEHPQGKSRWSLRLLAGKMVELGYVEELSYETVRTALKKMNSNPGRRSSGASHLSKALNLSIIWRIFWRYINVRLM